MGRKPRRRQGLDLPEEPHPQGGKDPQRRIVVHQPLRVAPAARASASPLTAAAGVVYSITAPAIPRSPWRR